MKVNNYFKVERAEPLGEATLFFDDRDPRSIRVAWIDAERAARMLSRRSKVSVYRTTHGVRAVVGHEIPAVFGSLGTEPPSWRDAFQPGEREVEEPR